MLPSVPLNTVIVVRSLIQYENLNTQSNALFEGINGIAHFDSLHMF